MRWVGALSILCVIAAAMLLTFRFSIRTICARLRAAADQYEIGDELQRPCPGNAHALRMIAFAIDGKDQPL